MILAIILLGLVILCSGVLIGFAISERMYKKEPIPSSTTTVKLAKTVPLCVNHQISKKYYENIVNVNTDEIISEYLAHDLSQEIMKYAKIDRIIAINRDLEEMFIYRARIDVVDRREADT